MRLHYDAVGDILYLDVVDPYDEQESDMIDDFIVARTNPATGTIENLEILFFSERSREAGGVVLDLGQLLRLAPAS